MGMETLERINQTLDFHKKKAPGVYLAVMMIEVAEDNFKIEEKTNYVVETLFCIPDPIQILKGATMGNRYLRSEIDSGRYAFTAFNRDTKEGIRVFLNASKVSRKKTPYFYEFYFRCRDLSKMTREQHNESVIKEIIESGRDFVSFQKVKVKLDRKEPMKVTARCGKCDEVFLLNREEQTVCGECEKGSDSYYELIEESEE